MTKLPKLAIVGRPNVGKSALFNRICKKKIAIVDEAEGVTRDRLYSQSDLFGWPFEVIDTGGIDAKSKALFNDHIKLQAEIAIEEADTIVMVVDGLVGITPLDQEVAKVLLRTRKPVCLAVNKIDDVRQENLMYNFQSLGISRIVAVSATQGWHVAELLEAAFADFNRNQAVEVEKDDSIKVAIIGRPNVGKSSLVNHLLQEERCIVSPIPGTTRDSIDLAFELNDQHYTLIDTAGIRRKHAEHEVVDKFATLRTERAIERADICILMLDAQQGITTQEKKIANMIEEAGKGCVLVFNKWDLVKGFRMEHCLKGIEEDASFLKHCPKLFVSVLQGRNIDKIFDMVQNIYQDSQKRITTHQLNKFVSSALQRNHPPMLKGKRLRIYYMAQVEIAPPRFVLFVNNPHLMTETYKKYLYNQFREEYGFTGVPIYLYLKGKEKKQRPDAPTAVNANFKEHARAEFESEPEFKEEHFDDQDEEWDDDFSYDENWDDGDQH